MALRSWFLECRPVHRLAWVEEDQRVIVLRPRLGESRLGVKIARTLGFPDYRVRLDDIGTAVWKWCDGESTAAQIADRMREAFGARIEPAEERLQSFLLQMTRARLIEIRVAKCPTDVSPDAVI